MKIDSKIAAFVLGLVVVFAGQIKAEELEDRGITLGARGQFFEPKDPDGDGEWSGGAQLRVFLNESFALEGSADYRREKFNSTRVDIYPLQASLLAYVIQAKPVGVFLLGGAGWYFTHVDAPSPADDQTDDRFGLHAGAGVEYRMSNTWSLDATYRYVWLDNLKTKNADLEDKEFDDNGQMVTVGLNYNF